MYMVGDKDIKDLTPKTANYGHRLVKNMRICGSGIYTYHVSEADTLGLSPIPAKYKDLTYINVYRPPEVLTREKDKFARIPITCGRHKAVNPTNAQDLMVGYVGDTVDAEVDKDDGETYLYTTGTIVAGDGIDAYEAYGNLSVGYYPCMHWQEGEHNGKKYQAVLDSFDDVNHVLICQHPRGGPKCMVMDSLDENTPLEKFVMRHNNGGNKMSVFSKIFGPASRQAKRDKLIGDANLVSAHLQAITAGADPATQVSKVRVIAGDSDVIFNGYLDELSAAKGEDPEVIRKAVLIVDEYYRAKLLGDSGGDPAPTDNTPPSVEKKSADKPKPEETVEKKSADKPKPEKAKPEETEDEKSADKPKPEKAKSEDKPKPEETTGDRAACSGDAIDYDRLATLVAAKLRESGPNITGDEGPVVVPPAVSDGRAKAKVDFDKEIWG